MTAFLNQGNSKSKVSFASPYPGKILPIDLTEFQGKFICQKSSFLCATKGVSVGIEFSQKLGRGLFGGEGFIMQKSKETEWHLYILEEQWLKSIRPW